MSYLAPDDICIREIFSNKVTFSSWCILITIEILHLIYSSASIRA
ncbi:hypothetical protein N499_1033 [Wolbachia pipientis wVitA]|nr:hypothetical protein N499_1033 [Wolbachia pipientis wVitA]